MKNYFAFIDESGNLSIEQYFGLGMLLVDEVGSLYDAVKPCYDKVRDIAKIQKEKTINDLLTNKRYEELAVVIDRKDPSFKPNEVFASPWHMYMSYAAMLLAANINNLGECRICILADDLTKPRNISETFEEAMTNKIHTKLKDDGIERTIFNVARLESHSSLMLQLVDILLGCVMYDFKKGAGLISDKLSQRQEIVVRQAREILEKDELAQHFTVHQPSYFNVWTVKWSK